RGSIMAVAVFAFLLVSACDQQAPPANKSGQGSPVSTQAVSQATAATATIAESLIQVQTDTGVAPTSTPKAPKAVPTDTPTVLSAVPATPNSGGASAARSSSLLSAVALVPKDATRITFTDWALIKQHGGFTGFNGKQSREERIRFMQWTATHYLEPL